MDTLTMARSWIDNGFSVIPIGYRSKRPAFNALKATGHVDDDGTPVWEPFKERQATNDELRQWFTGPKRNIGVVTGWRGLVVLDFDNLEAYQAWLAWAKTEGGIAAQMSASTYRVASARGMHVYLVVNEPVDSYRVGEIDVKARWGYVLVPPSIHPSGFEYTGIGQVIARCEKLADVFPFERPEPVTVTASMAATNDPWEAAARAVECGGVGAVANVKRTVQVADLVTIARSDPGGAWAHCPLHADWNPSLRIYKDGHFHCFQCGAHGDAIDLYAAIRGLTLREAIAELGQMVGG
jgi:hypothetical protein